NAVSLVSSNATNSTTVNFNGAQVAGNIVYQFDRTATAGTYAICTSAGNCLGGGGSGAKNALSNLASVAINTSLLPGVSNSIDAGSSSFLFRSGYFGTSVLTPSLDTASAGALTIGGTTATSIAIGKTASNVQTTINGTTLVKPTSGNDSTTAFQVQQAGGTAVLTADTTNSQVKVQGINSVATVGSELLSGNCSGTNWSGTGSGPYTHTSGSATPLTCTITGGVTS